MTDYHQNIINAHATMTAPGSFYEQNGGRFKGQPVMTRDEELAYIDRMAKAPDHELTGSPIPASLSADIMGGLAAGDVVIVKVPGAELTRAVHEHIAATVSAAMPHGVRVLVLADRVTIGALRPPVPYTLDGPELWEILFTMLKGDVPDVLDESTCSAIAAAIVEAHFLGARPQREDLPDLFNTADTFPAPEPTTAPTLPGVYWTSEDGDPWAVVFEGEGWTPENCTADVIAAVIHSADPEAAAEFLDNPTPAEVFYITAVPPWDRGEKPKRRKGGDEDGDDLLAQEGALYFCKEGEAGAYRVVGIKLS